MKKIQDITILLLTQEIQIKITNLMVGIVRTHKNSRESKKLKQHQATVNKNQNVDQSPNPSNFSVRINTFKIEVL